MDIEILKILKSMQKQLDDIQCGMKKLENKVDALENKVAMVESKINLIEHNQLQFLNKISSFENKNSVLEMNINNLMNKFNSVENTLNDVEYRIDKFEVLCLDQFEKLDTQLNNLVQNESKNSQRVNAIEIITAQNWNDIITMKQRV